MADNHIVLFPVCLKKYREIYKIYIPAVDMETRAVDYLDALDKARKMLQIHITIDAVDRDMIMEAPCEPDKVIEFIKEKNREEYEDAQIIFVDYNTKNNINTELGEIPVKIPKYLINDLEHENIDCSGIFKNVVEEVIRRKRLYNEVHDWTEETVEIISLSGRKYYGRIKSIRYDKDSPWDFTIRLQTGLCDSIRIDSSAIEEINAISLVMNELGTFHIVNQEGMISLMGELWWKNRHIDVYLEYDASVEIEKQETFGLLEQFNKTKYEFDDAVRPVIAKKLIDIEEIDALFIDYPEENPFKRKEFILDQFIKQMELWYIDISSDNTIYMDYNFDNGVGKLSVGITKNPDDTFTFKYNGASIYSDKES